MPIYEYHCEGCGKNFEFLALRKDEQADCPSCKCGDTKKLISACGFISKGSGGETVSSSASSCGSCSSGSCSTCH
ncbi:MAG: zinc ribbon domain-containing protein [Desulfobacterales bacterium]|nr:zinc ribbon domain-containing protein [Desulfobacterales bacterium]